MIFEFGTIVLNLGYLVIRYSVHLYLSVVAVLLQLLPEKAWGGGNENAF